MKNFRKLFLATMLIMLSISFTSCTDETDETIRINQQDTVLEAPQVDPTKVKPPTGG